MKVTIETDNDDEAFTFLTATKTKAEVWDMQHRLRNYLKYEDRTSERDDAMLEEIYSTLCNLTYKS